MNSFVYHCLTEFQILSLGQNQGDFCIWEPRELLSVIDLMSSSKEHHFVLEASVGGAAGHSAL